MSGKPPKPSSQDKKVAAAKDNPRSMESYLRPEVIQQVSRLDLRARFIVEGFLSGLHGSPFQGFSVEFSEHRKYTPGDDIKDIDWNVYAKTEKYYVKKFKAETTMQGWLVVDSSASMGWTFRQEMTKFDYAISLTAALAYLMIYQQDPVGLAVCGKTIERILPPRARRSHLPSMLSTLTNLKPHGETDLGACLIQLAGVARGKGLVIVLSDLLTDIDPVIAGLHRLRHSGHEVIVFNILDEAETRFPFDGYCQFEDIESAATLTLEAKSIRQDYLDALSAHQTRFKDECHKAQIDFVPMDTSVNFGSALLEYLQQRSRRF